MSIEFGNLLKIPRGTPGLEPLQIELQEIQNLELRKEEIAIANKSTALELMSSFIKACDILNKHIARVSFEYNQSVKYLKQREAIVLLDVAPAVLTQKKAGNSQDLRKAVVSTDGEYLELFEKSEIIKSTYVYLKGKLKTFEMAYQSVKKVYYNEDMFEANQHDLRTEYETSSDESLVDESGLGRAIY